MGRFLLVCAIDIIVGVIIFGRPFMELAFMEPLVNMYCVIIVLWILSRFSKELQSTMFTIGLVYVAGTMIYLFSESFRDFFNHLFHLSYQLDASEFNPSTSKVVIYALISWGLLGLCFSKGNEEDGKKSTETPTADDASDDEEWNRPSDGDDEDCETPSDGDTEDCKMPADGNTEEACDDERRDRESF